MNSLEDDKTLQGILANIAEEKVMIQKYMWQTFGCKAGQVLYQT
jgi:hypothetical protein